MLKVTGMDPNATIAFCTDEMEHLILKAADHRLSSQVMNKLWWSVRTEHLIAELSFDASSGVLLSMMIDVLAKNSIPVSSFREDMNIMLLRGQVIVDRALWDDAKERYFDLRNVAVELVFGSATFLVRIPNWGALARRYVKDSIAIGVSSDQRVVEFGVHECPSPIIYCIMEMLAARGVVFPRTKSG